MVRIGCFDSGIGGLLLMVDVMLELRQKYGNIDIDFVHIGDTLNMPYGEKSASELASHTEALIKILSLYRCDIVIAGCNTILAVIDPQDLEELARMNNMVGLFNLIERSALGLYNSTDKSIHSAHIGILATSNTIHSKKYHNLLHGMFEADNRAVTIYDYKASDWAYAVEYGLYMDNEFIMKLQSDVRGFLSHSHVQDITHIGLFCTHYSALNDLILTEIRRHGCNASLYNQSTVVTKLIEEKVDLTTIKKVEKMTPITSILTGMNTEHAAKVVKSLYGNIMINFI